MKGKNDLKGQAEDDLARLQQENYELKEALKRISAHIGVPPGSWFATGKNDLISSLPGKLATDNPPRKYKFSDLVDIELIKKLLHSFYVATGIPHGLHDEENNIISGKGWQDICIQFHRVCPETVCRCKQSDTYIAAHLYDGPYVGYKCMNGLMDFGTPIIVEGQHIASIFLGQFLHEPPDREYFRRQAQVCGFDEVAYMEALDRVPIIPEEQIAAIMGFYSQVGQMLATMGLERKRLLETADQTIREQQERFNLVWETINDGFWDWDIEKDELIMSPRWGEMLGYSPEEVEPHFSAWIKLVHPEDVNTTLRTVTEHLHGNTATYEAEYRMLTKTKQWKWIMSRGQVVARNEKGQPLRMVGINLDISRRKQAELALILSEEKFFKAFHRNPDLMSISTLNEGRYVEVNDSFVEITGYERHEVIGRTNLEIGIYPVPAQRDNIIKQVQEHGSIRNIETRYRLKSGEIRDFNLSGERIDIDEEPHLLFTTRDITEPKKMEKALRLSEESLAKAFDTSPILMTITTLETGRFRRANKAFCRIWGYSNEEIADHSTLELGFWANPADRELITEDIRAGQSIQNLEIQWSKKGGEPRLGLLSAEGLELNGELCILAVLKDITDLRQMEIEMTRLDRLNLVGEMAASIGHEIRNPMTVVRGYLQFLQEKKEFAQETEYFDLMIDELDRANSIITEFLSLAKNKMVEMAPANLNSIISKTMPLIQTQALRKEHRIKAEMQELPVMPLDEKEIRQLILNLVNNAMEAMLSPGIITIKTYIKHNHVVLAIHDQGHGIDQALLDKLGTPFFTTKDQGTGLGLAVCYRIASHHRAKIDIETSSAGTVFYVSFPIPAVSQQ